MTCPVSSRLVVSLQLEDDVEEFRAHVPAMQRAQGKEARKSMSKSANQCIGGGGGEVAEGRED